MDKFYRVKKDTFLWKEGAIIKRDDSLASGEGGYKPIEDIWGKNDKVGFEYICADIIEHPSNEEYFERIYHDKISGNLFRTKEKLIEMYEAAFSK